MSLDCGKKSCGPGDMGTLTPQKVTVNCEETVLITVHYCYYNLFKKKKTA